MDEIWYVQEKYVMSMDGIWYVQMKGHTILQIRYGMSNVDIQYFIIMVCPIFAGILKKKIAKRFSSKKY